MTKISSDEFRRTAQEVQDNAQELTQEASRLFHKCFDLRQRLLHPQNYTSGSDETQ